MRRLFFILTALVLLVGTAALYTASGRLHERARAALEAAAARQWQREVRIGALRGDPLRGFVLERVAVARGQRLADGTLLSAERIVLRIRSPALLGGVLRRRDLWRSLEAVTLIRPEISLEISPEGRWNLAALLAGRGAPAGGLAAFTPLITIHDGRLDLTDFSGPPRPFRARLREVDGQVDLRRPPVVRLDLTLVSLRAAQRSPLTVRGRYLLNEGSLDVDLRAEAMPVEQWGPYTVRTPTLLLEGGSADAAFHVLSTPWGAKRTLDYRGTIRLVDGAATLGPQRARLRAVRGTLWVDPVRIQTDDLTLTVEGSPLRVRGEMALPSGPRLDLVLSSPRLDLATVKRLLFPGWRARLEGTTGADVRVTGPLSAPTVDGTITEARGILNQQPLRVASAGLQLVGGLLVFDDFRAVTEGARIGGELRLSIGAGDLLVSVEGEGVSPEMLRRAGITVPLPVRGPLSGSVTLGRNAAAFVGEAAGSMTGGFAGPVRVDQLRAGGWFEDGGVAFPYLVALRGKTTVRASGTVSPRGALDVDAVGTGLDLGTVAREVGVEPRVEGRADAEGRITGTVQAPLFEGTVVVGPGLAASFAFDRAEGPLRLTRHTLATSGLRLREGEGTYVVAGSIRWTQPAALALTIDAREIPAAALTRSAGLPLRLSGRISGHLGITGTPTRPDVAGQVALTAGSVAGQPIDEATAAFRWQGGTLVLEGARARVRDSAVTASGRVDRNGVLRLNFAARGFDLRHLTFLPSAVAQASGRVDLDGQIGGTTARPTVAATLSSPDLRLNGQAFDRAEGVVRWTGDSLLLDPVTLSQGEGLYLVRGSLRVGDPFTFDLRGEVARGRLATLLALGRLHPSVALDGRLDGTVTLRGTAARPAVGLEARLSGGRFGDHAIEQADLRLGYQDAVLTVQRLNARAAGGVIAAQGRLGFAGDSQFEVGGADVSVDLLRPLLGAKQPLSGTLNFTTQISGPLPDPEIGLSLEVRDGGIGGLRFDSLVANIFYKDGTLNVEQALLSEDGHRIKAVGAMPFNPARGVFAEQGAMRFEISLEQADLSVLALLLPQVAEAAGRLEGRVLLSGTPRHPEMSGRLAVRDGRLRLRSVATLLEDVRADVSFNQNRLALDGLTARMGAGTVTASGAVAVANFRPAALERVALQARDVRLDVRPYYAGLLDGELTLSGPIGDPAHLPEVVGRLTFKRGELDASALLSSALSGGGTPLAYRGPELRLRDVQLTTGDDLVVRLGRLRVDANPGDVVLAGGTLRRPTLNGRLTADRGTVTLFGRTFTLRAGEARFFPQFGLKPLISLDAETDVDVVELVGLGQARRVVPTRIFLEARQVFPEELAERVVLRSEPPHSREELVAVLSGQRSASAGADVRLLLQAELSRALFGDVEQSIARAFGLSEFAVSYDFVEPLQLRIGRLLVRDLYLRLTTVFDVETRFVWSLEWRVYRNFLLTFSVDTEGRTDTLLRYTLRF